MTRAVRNPSNPELFWAQVTAFGALWGALEITLGAFLHALRIPFSGAALASLGAALLVAERQIVPARWASLATAAVAALCKSISPGGVILGPMIGILLGGLLVELALFVRPRSFTLAILAGALCGLGAIGQRLLMSYLFYGASVIELYVQLLTQAGTWLGLGSAAGWRALLVLLGAAGAIGAAGGLLGFRLGRDAERLIAGTCRRTVDHG